MADKTVGVPVRALYAIPEAMVLLSLSRTQIYELIRSDRLLTVTQGRRWLVPAEAISAYVALLLSEAGNVRRSFRRVAAAAGLDAQAWTPRELRHSFVSLLSSTGMSIEDISHLVGHASSRVTELVYRKELRPVVLTRGASAMDALFPHEKPGA